jgi:SAM-dependent methyltransferase
MSEQPRLYRELADWFHLLTAPEEYVEEAEAYRRIIVETSARPVRDVLELGSGGGNNASHLRAHFTMTLTDLSPKMLAMSRRINPECEHIEGDMRTLRLNRDFDAVFVHDAIDYITSLPDLRAVMETAFLHCRPGGVALFAPDLVRETFQSSSDHGGNDADGRGLRYLEWTWDPDPNDDTFVVDFAYLLRQEDGSVRVELDRHVCGLFPRGEWLRLLEDVGFRANRRVVEREDEEKGTEVFTGLRPPPSG